MVDYRAFHRYPFLSPTLDGTNSHSTVDCPTQDMKSGKTTQFSSSFPGLIGSQELDPSTMGKGK